MNIHEYQAKGLLKKYGAPVLEGGVAYTAAEAVDEAKKLGGPVWVVKAQIHAGGRGKAGGVKVVKSLDDVGAVAKELIGKTLVTHQTGPEGKEVKRVYIEDGCRIKSEFYLSMLLDRASGKLAIMASTEGGMDIEEVAEATPEKIIKETVDPDLGLQAYQGRKIAIALGLRGKLIGQCGRLLQGLYATWAGCDASMVEVNPLALIENEDGTEAVVALDAKMSIDSNAMFRHADIAEMRDLTEEDPLEVEAGKFDLNYIALEGNIGCMVNGAGLAMSTMDVIQLKGGKPANFLDVGGGADKEQVTNAFKILLSDDNVRGILVNIFGGIMKCDTIAEGVIAAAKEVKLSVPLVVRLEGTNVELGRKLLEESGIDLQTASSLDEAAEKVVAAIR